MKTLQNTFKGRGSQSDYQFTLVKREGLKAIYQKDLEVYGKHAGTSFEVIIIRQRGESSRIVGDSTVNYDAMEIYPCDSEFGVMGWNTMSLSRAEEIYDSIDIFGKKIAKVSNHTT